MARAPIYETEINRAPALRISNIVKGRENRNGRVYYFIDPTGSSTKRAIPEKVVLARWKKRKMDGHTFDGCRLGPNFWRAIGKVFGPNAKAICGLEQSILETSRNDLNAEKRKHHLYLPDASLVRDLLTLLGPFRLQAILDRHLDPNRRDIFGTPDLFLLGRDSFTLGPSFYRMVEVKKPREQISRDQHEEIAFLRSIGVPARVLRLIERN